MSCCMLRVACCCRANRSGACGTHGTRAKRVRRKRDPLWSALSGGEVVEGKTAHIRPGPPAFFPRPSGPAVLVCHLSPPAHFIIAHVQHATQRATCTDGLRTARSAHGTQPQPCAVATCPALLERHSAGYTPWVLQAKGTRRVLSSRCHAAAALAAPAGTVAADAHDSSRK
jgi:hypothetical protein